MVQNHKPHCLVSLVPAGRWGDGSNMCSIGFTYRHDPGITRTPGKHDHLDTITTAADVAAAATI